jgi:hypothetical protein
MQLNHFGYNNEIVLEKETQYTNEQLAVEWTMSSKLEQRKITNSNKIP